MLQRDPEDIDRKSADIVGAEPELHRIREVDLDVELRGSRLGRRVLSRSSDGTHQEDERENAPPTARLRPIALR